MEEMVAFDVEWIIREAMKIELYFSSVNTEVTLSWTVDTSHSLPEGTEGIVRVGT